jgi:predicted ABC-type ATPase
LPDADTAVARVALRVEQGGHFIPELVIRRRFKRGLLNFNADYKQAVDDWALYDNTGGEPLLLEWGENN